MRDRLPLIIAITALLVAVLGATPLGQAAYDAVVPANSVGTPQLQRNAVKAAKIAPNAVRTGHVLDGTLLAQDFKEGQIPQGPKGEKGDKGDKGDRGDPATRFWATVSSAGTVTAQQGATGAARLGTGSYTVDFSQNVSQCAVLATQATYGNAYASARPLASSPNRVSVSIYVTYASTQPPALIDASFAVAVFC